MRLLLRLLPYFFERRLHRLSGRPQNRRLRYTRDCVLRRQLSCYGVCEEFPCETILTRPRVTVLDRDWLLWKAQEKNT